MSIGNIGAKIVKKEERQHFNCVIKKISCSYNYEEKDVKEAELYSFEKAAAQAEAMRQEEETPPEPGVFSLGISYEAYPRFYFISNHKGKKVKFDCLREANKCRKEEHTKYHIACHNLDTRKFEVGNERDVNQGDYRIYYYNIMYRTVEYSKSAANAGADLVDSPYVIANSPALALIGSGGRRALGSAVGGAAGASVGSLADYICALRFFTLPLISETDETYYYQTTLNYSECPHSPRVTQLDIQVYPDIEYTFNLNFSIKRNYEGDKNKQDSIKNGGFGFSLKVKYADLEKELGMEEINASSTELDTKAKKGTLFYNNLCKFKRGLQAIYQFSTDLETSLAETYGKGSSITSDVRSIGNAIGRVGYGNSRWLKTSLSLQPSVECKWRYHVPDDLREIKRFIEFTLGINAKGALTIDLVELANLSKGSTSKPPSVGEIAKKVAAIAAGGVVAIVKELVYWICKLLIDEFFKNLKAELEISVEGDLKPFTFNTIENRTVSSSLEISLGAKIYIGFEIEGDFEVFVNVKVEGKAKAEAKFTFKILIGVECNDGEIAFSIGSEMPPVEITLEYGVTASFSIIDKKDKGNKNDDKSKSSATLKYGHEGTPKQFKFGGAKWGPAEHKLFPKDKDA